MATTSTIGSTGRNYSTIQAWHDAFTTGGWIGECYKDSEFVVSGTTTFSGKSTSATNYIILRCASGQSFRDNANKLTNALKYNASNGVAWRSTSSYSNTLNIFEDYVTISGMQIKCGSLSGNVGVSIEFATCTHSVIEYCIIQSDYNVGLSLSSGMARNCLCITTSSSSNGYGIRTAYPASGTKIINCTSVRPAGGTVNSSAFGNFGAGAGGVTIENCAGFGFGAFSSTTSYVGSNNCSDQTIGFGTNNQASKTYANQFENNDVSSQDFRLKTGSDCIGNGVTDTTNIPNSDDIVGTARS